MINIKKVNSNNYTNEKSITYCTMSFVFFLIAFLLTIISYKGVNSFAGAITAILIAFPFLVAGLIFSLIGFKHSDHKDLICWITLLLNFVLLVFYIPFEKLPYYTDISLVFKDKTETRVCLDRTNITNSGLKHLKAFKHIRVLLLHNTNITDDGLIHIKDLKSLSALTLPDQISDKGLVYLKNLENLNEIHISNSKVKGPGLIYLQNIKKLYLSKTEISNSGLKYLMNSKHLEYLDLSNTQISDEGLKNLTHLKKLKSININNTKISNDGKKKLLTFIQNSAFQM